MDAKVQDDRILLITRIVAAVVIPVLIAAFIVLYFFTQRSGELFAWQIKPNLTAIYMGAGYIGGAYIFLQTLIGRRWHRVSSGYPAVTSFTIIMLIATFLHWSRFDLRHFPFQTWLVLYIITPFLVPWLWWHNKPYDSGAPEENDLVVSNGIQKMFVIFGAGLILVAMIGLLMPSLYIRVWPWTLTPLTAQVMAGWITLLGVGNLVAASDNRWSSWRVGAISIGVWHALFLIGSLFYRQEFTNGQWLNWFTLSVSGMLILVIGFYFGMESLRRKVPVME
jgi:hypothetical protein